MYELTDLVTLGDILPWIKENKNKAMSMGILYLPCVDDTTIEWLLDQDMDANKLYPYASMNLVHRRMRVHYAMCIPRQVQSHAEMAELLMNSTMNKTFIIRRLAPGLITPHICGERVERLSVLMT